MTTSCKGTEGGREVTVTFHVALLTFTSNVALDGSGLTSGAVSGSVGSATETGSPDSFTGVASMTCTSKVLVTGMAVADVAWIGGVELGIEGSSAWAGRMCLNHLTSSSRTSLKSIFLFLVFCLVLWDAMVSIVGEATAVGEETIEVATRPAWGRLGGVVRGGKSAKRISGLPGNWIVGLLVPLLRNWRGGSAALRAKGFGGWVSGNCDTADWEAEPSMGDVRAKGVGCCGTNGLWTGGDKGVVRVVTIDLLAI